MEKRAAGSSSSEGSKQARHLNAMLKDQEKVASSVYAKRIVGWRMQSDDSPIEFALREYGGADEYDEDEERLRALGPEKEWNEGFVTGFGEDDDNIHWVQIDNERLYGNGARELFSFLFQMGWRERPEVQLGVPIPELTTSKGFVTIEGHGVGPLGTPMFRVQWGAKKKSGSKDEETWIHAYDTVHCPLALLEYVAKENYEHFRLPRGLSVENFEAYVIEHYDWDMYEPDDDDDEGPDAGSDDQAPKAAPQNSQQKPQQQPPAQPQGGSSAPKAGGGHRKRKRSVVYGSKGRR